MATDGLPLMDQRASELLAPRHIRQSVGELESGCPSRPPYKPRDRVFRQHVTIRFRLCVDPLVSRLSDSDRVCTWLSERKISPRPLTPLLPRRVGKAIREYVPDIVESGGNAVPRLFIRVRLPARRNPCCWLHSRRRLECELASEQNPVPTYLCSSWCGCQRPATDHLPHPTSEQRVEFATTWSHCSSPPGWRLPGLGEAPTCVCSRREPGRRARTSTLGARAATPS